jgi:TonB family protein
MSFNSMVYSFILHLLLLVLVIFGLPSFERLPQETAITVEVVPISKVSNIKPKKVVKKKLDQEQPEKAKEVPKSVTEKEEDKPKEEPKKEPEKPKDEPKPDEKKEPIKKIKEKEKKEEKKEDDKKPDKKDKKKDKKKDEKKKDKPKKKKQKNNELDSLLKTLEDPSEGKDKDAKETKQEKTLDDELNDDKSDSNKYDNEKPLSLSEEDAIRSQIAKCWTVPAGAAEAGSMNVVLRISLQPDGDVTSVEVLSSSSYSKKDSTFFRAAADSAVRAVKRCSPLKNLPKEKYGSWKDLELNFDPKDMVY